MNERKVKLVKISSTLLTLREHQMNFPKFSETIKLKHHQ